MFKIILISSFFFKLDSVIRTCYYKYPHPKEAYIQNGLLNRGILRLMDSSSTSESLNSTSGLRNLVDLENANEYGQGITFVYPFGATLNVVCSKF